MVNWRQAERYLRSCVFVRWLKLKMFPSSGREQEWAPGGGGNGKRDEWLRAKKTKREDEGIKGK